MCKIFLEALNFTILRDDKKVQREILFFCENTGKIFDKGEITMASLTSVSNSNYVSSLHNSTHVISGLASGMDTESMIENLTKGYQTKIKQLQQKSTKISWKQDAYRSIISKMSAFTKKYTSYTSSTNLMSQSFFQSAVTATAQGEYADKVSTSGRTSSDIQLNSVDQLATSARFVSKGLFNQGDGKTITASEGIDLNATTEVGTLQGTLSLTYGNKLISIGFSESDIIERQTKDDGSMETNAEALARVINEKLGDEDIVLSSGTSVKANTRVEVKVGDDGTISFSDKSSAGNNVYLSGVSGTVGDVLGLKDLSSDSKQNSFKVDNDNDRFFSKDVENMEKISGKTMNINLDGVTKQIKMPEISKTEDGKVKINGTEYAIGTDDEKKAMHDAYAKALEEAVQKEFGSNIKVENTSGDSSLKLEFTIPEGSNLLINTDAGDVLGIGKTASSYLSTGKKLSDLGILDSNDTGKHDFVINGVKVGSYDKDTTLSTIMSDINSSSAGVKVTYSKTSGEFVFTSKDTGAHTEISITDENNNLAAKMFGVANKDSENWTKGTDAQFTVTVNGSTQAMTRTTNNVEIDGLKMNLKGTFNKGTYQDVKNAATSADRSNAVKDLESVSFHSETKSDDVVKAIKTMVDDYNAMISEIRTAYATMPNQTSSGAMYEPLTDEDAADMSESAVKNYEEKAKQGILFADSNLSTLYNNLVNVFSRGGADGTMLKKIGISTGYSTSDGASTIELDESKLREALETDMDSVIDLFTRSTDSGAGTDGIMQSVKTQLDRYGATTGAVKGILVQQAGTPLASLSLLDNGWQKEMDNISTQIEKLQNKMTTQVDRYTQQFSRLEILINQMNSQSSTLAGMMGG